jgi:hypothetical protein
VTVVPLVVNSSFKDEELKKRQWQWGHLIIIIILSCCYNSVN